MKKNLKLLFLFILFLISTSKVKAISVPKEITLYYTTINYREYITQPTELKDKYQLQIENATYKVIDGTSVKVSNNGLITPNVTTFYCKSGWCQSYSTPPDPSSYTKILERLEEGDSTVEVTVGSEKHNITVHVINYATYNAEKIMTDYVKNNVDDSMTEYEKMKKIMELTAKYSYSVDYSDYVGLISGAGADCIGNSSAILFMADLAGIEAHLRQSYHDPTDKGAGSNHHNVSAILDNKLYIVEDGYVGQGGTLARKGQIFDTVDGFTLSSNRKFFVQYDGYDEEVTIPDNSTVNKLGDFAFYYGKHNKTKVKTVHMSKNITELGKGAFVRVNTLTDVIIDADNPTYKSINGSVYSKDETILYDYPSGKTESTFTIPDKVKEISDYAVSYNDNLTDVKFNNKINKIGAYAFYNSNIKGAIVPETVTEIGENAFGDDAISSSEAKLKYLVVKNSQATLGKGLCGGFVPIYGLKGSTTEEYAKENNCYFGEITGDETEFKLIENTNITSTPVEFKDDDENRPDLHITDGDYELKENVDYKIAQLVGNNRPNNYAAARIIGIGKYAGYIQHDYVINEKTIKYKYVNPVVNYNGEEQSPIIEVLDKDIKVQYGNNSTSGLSTELRKYTMPGTYKFGVVLSGPNYKSVYLNDLEFKIKGIDITDAEVSEIPNALFRPYYPYRPEVEVTKDGKKLNYLTDFTVSYQDNYLPGKATLTIKGQGIYEGTIERNFYIVDVDTMEFSLPPNMTVNIGSKTKLDLTLNPYVELKPTWKSDNDSIVSVSDDGVITANELGSTKITATYKTRKASINITVTDYLKGDLTRSGKLEVVDATEALLRVIETIKTTDEDIVIADFDGNNKIDVSDATEILLLYINQP